MYGDPKMQALMRETGKIATWEIYTAQTLELEFPEPKTLPDLLRAAFLALG